MQLAAVAGLVNEPGTNSPSKSGCLMSTTQTHILITGPPGCGKTTVIKRVIEGLPGVHFAGFYTQEIREQGRRTGFEMVGLQTGKCVLLASVHSNSELRLRRYGIELLGLDEIVKQELHDEAVPQLFVIDEIGKIELYSRLFIETVQTILDGKIPVLGTVAVRGEGLIRDVKQRQDIDVIEVTEINRDDLPRRIVDQIGLAIAAGHN